MSGIKHDQGKPDLSLLDRAAMEEVALVLGFGAQKYSRDNWRSGISKERLIASVLRHAMASNDGELKDPESGLSHLAHAIAGLMFALHFEKRPVVAAPAAKAPASSFNVHLGKRYRRRDGEITGPLMPNLTLGTGSIYPFHDPEHRFSYTKHGVFVLGKPGGSEQDLVEEINGEDTLFEPGAPGLGSINGSVP